MTLGEVKSLLDGEWVTAGADDSVRISGAYTSDMLSDVMGNAPGDSVLITIQNHVNTVAVCTLADIKAIILCHGREAPADMKAAAEREGVAIMITSLNQFSASCRLAELGGSR